MAFNKGIAAPMDVTELTQSSGQRCGDKYSFQNRWESIKCNIQTKKRATKLSSQKVKALKKWPASVLVQPKSIKSKELAKEHKYAGKRGKDLVINDKHLLPHYLDCVLILHSRFFFFFKKKAFSVL